MTTEATGIPTPQVENRDPVSDELPGLASSQAQEADAPVKRRRKRGPNKAKASQAPVTAPVQDPETQARELRELSQALGLGFKMGGKVAAAVRGDHWLIADHEAEALGDAWAVALAPYMARMTPYMGFITASVVTVGVFVPKVQQDRNLSRGTPAPLPAPRKTTTVMAIHEDAPVDHRSDADAPATTPTKRSSRARSADIPLADS